jgi:predicted glycosyltransferase
LKNYNIDHVSLSSFEKNLIGLAKELLVRQSKLLPLLIKNKIDVVVSVTGASCVHICKLLGIPTLVFYDTEHASLQLKLTLPFCTYFITPEAFEGRLGKMHLTYSGFHDLAYLHPNYFQPDPKVLEDLGVMPDERFVILRFVAWKAAHDIGHRGLSLELKRRIIGSIKPHAKIFIVPEANLEAEFDQYRFKLEPSKIFDALYYSTMYICEGGSMATEAAVLGTPSIFKELQNKYDLMYAFQPSQEDEIIKKISDILGDENVKEKWKDRCNALFNSNADVTDWMVRKILGSGRKK